MNEPSRVERDHHVLNIAIGSPTFVEGTDLGLLLFDMNGRIIDVNPAATVLASLSREEFIGHTMGELGLMLIHPDGSPFRSEDLPSARTMREGANQNHVIIGSDLPGRPLRWIDVSAQLVSVGAEERAVLVTWNDLTDEVVRGQSSRSGAELFRWQRPPTRPNKYSRAYATSSSS